MIAANPGSQTYRLGVVLGLYEAACFKGDLETASTMLGIIATYCSPHMTDKEWKAYNAMPGFQYGDNREREEVFRDMNERLRNLLKVAKDHNVFSKHEVELGDGSALDGDQE